MIPSSKGKLLLFALILSCLARFSVVAGTLTGSFAAVSAGTDVNLTAVGRLDWVHWGLTSDTSVDRKVNVTPQISDFTVVYDTNFSYANAYQYTDNANGYSWSDGTPTTSVTNTTTGVYVVGPFNLTETNGFAFTLPADTSLKTLKVYVGSYAAKGRFQASLSDSSATAYSNNTAVFNFTNGPGGVFTINFSANSSNQTLTIRWTVAQKYQMDGNVTLQAAALDAVGANNPPAVSLISPTNTAQFSAPANITLSASASDTDGTISKVEFFNSTNKIGEATNSPYTCTWSNVASGHYLISAKASDNGGGIAVTPASEIFVYTSGGTVIGNSADAPSVVGLTIEGKWDWAHWGLNGADTFNHKSGVARQISNVAKIGTNSFGRYGDNYTQFSWEDGDPIVSTNCTVGIFIHGFENGFQLTAPADTTTRTLNVYVGLYGAEGSFRAYLSDATAPAYLATLSNVYGSSYAVYTLTYAAANSGQTLNVEFTCKSLFDADFGNLTLQAATLSGSGTPAPVVLLDPKGNANDLSFSFNSASNWTYVIEASESLGSGDWQFCTNVTGNGSVLSVTNTILASPLRFYRARTE